MLAAVVHALVCALYFDRGMDTLRRFVHIQFLGRVNEIALEREELGGLTAGDIKSKLCNLWADLNRRRALRNESELKNPEYRYALLRSPSLGSANQVATETSNCVRCVCMCGYVCVPL